MILVVGGTGRLGTRLVTQLVDRGEEVRVLARGAGTAAGLADAGVELVPGDVRDPIAVHAAMRDVRVCVAAMHGLTGRGGASPATVDRDGNRCLTDSARASGARVVLVSVVGAAPDSGMELFRMKWAAEQYLRDSGVPWTIVRATAFAEAWVDILTETATRDGRIRVLGRGENPINFAAIADVADAVLRAIDDRGLRGEVVEVGGRTNITMNRFAALLDSREPVHVPRPALRLMSLLARPLRPDRARLAKAALVMDTDDLTFDPTSSLATYPWLRSTGVGQGVGSPGTP